MTDTEKDIAAIDIGIKAIERNKAAIEECREKIGLLSLFHNSRERDIVVATYESILKILEGN